MAPAPGWKAIVGPVFFAAAPAGALVLWFAVLSGQPDEGATTHRHWIWGLVVAVALVWTVLCVAPLLAWRCEHFALTTEHISAVLANPDREVRDDGTGPAPAAKRH